MDLFWIYFEFAVDLLYGLLCDKLTTDVAGVVCVDYIFRPTRSKIFAVKVERQHCRKRLE